MKDYSLNETASRCRLAAKGAGYSWGMAEEVSQSVFWLIRHNLPGPATLLSLLSSYTADETIHHSIPTVSAHCFTAKGHWLCPVASGCALSDAYSVFDDDTQVTLTHVNFPLLLLPFIAELSMRSNTALVIDIAGEKTVIDGQRIRFSDSKLSELSQAEVVTCRVATKSERQFGATDEMPLYDRVFVDSKVWDGLGSFAHETYAPATESSRELGAGAGLNDND